MSKYGRTWWGQKWLETFTGIDNDNRLPRGRTYANTGRAYDIQLKGNVVTAKVKGSMPRPYKVEVVLNAFSQADKKVIRQSIEDSPTILSELLSRQLPVTLFDKLGEHGIKLFPSRWRDVRARCDCPDSAVPCKHIAAVIYLMCAEIDKNPFMVFTLHDCDLQSLILDFGGGNLQRAKKITQIDDIFKPSEDLEDNFDQSTLEAVHFADIRDFDGCITGILSDDPAFYPNNFREVLAKVYKHWRRGPTRAVDNYILADRLGEPKPKKKTKMPSEEQFANGWAYPEAWDDFQLNIDDYHQVVYIQLGAGKVLEAEDPLAFALVRFFRELPPSYLHKLSPKLRFLHTLSQFAIKLMAESALMPQLLQNNKGEVFIRWVPALFDEAVKEVFQKLCAICPPDLVKHKKYYLNKPEQVKVALSLLFEGLMYQNCSDQLGGKRGQEILGLFFEQNACEFNAFDSQEIPGVIQQWLSDLYLTEKLHKLYLHVEEDEEKGNMEVLPHVALKKEGEPLPLKQGLSQAGASERLEILSDLSLLSKYIPALAPSIESGEGAVFSLHEFTTILFDILPVLKALGVGVILPKTLQKILKPQLKLEMKAKDKLSKNQQNLMGLENLLDFNWRIALGDKQLTLAEFKELIKNARGMVRLMDDYVLLNEDEIAALLKQAEQLPDELSSAEVMHAALSGQVKGVSVSIDDQLTKMVNRLSDYKPVSVPSNLKAELRPYQERGFSWLVQNIETGFGSILADDMGLGKTVQVIAAILHLKNKKRLKDGRVLIVAPTSLLSNWRREIERFAPSLNLHIYHGLNREVAEDYDVLITSYGLARRDLAALKKQTWELLVIDEAQNIKNPTTAQTKSIKAIEANHRIAMSGTPVENRLLEYWSIFDFANKHYLGGAKQFHDRFAKPIELERDKDCLDCFNKITRPFMLRRLKSDKSIIQDLPDKIESNRYATLTSEQAALYQGVVERALDKIGESDGIERKGLVLKMINSLKQICNHPSQFGKKKTAAIDQSGKLQILEEIIVDIEEAAEKVLIFTQYTEMGDILAKVLEERFKVPVPFLHGGLSIKARDALVQAFQSNPQNRILLVSLKAGGTGLNLTAASHVIHYDLWWNPAVEAQATDRAYRIGQKKNVLVHRLLTSGTFEERINEMIQSKKELSNLTVGSGESWITNMSNQELREMVMLKDAD